MGGSLDGELGLCPWSSFSTSLRSPFLWTRMRWGRMIAQRLMQDLPQASRQVPIRKDWNEDLKTQLQTLHMRIYLVLCCG